jgi:septal ring factor EnvC (AmiA/AmiB activator)
MRKAFIFILILAIALPMGALETGSMSFVAEAQTSTQPAVCANPTSDDIAQACKDFADESATLAKLQAQLAAQKAKSGSLQKGVNAIISQITATQAKIRAKITSIGQLSTDQSCPMIHHPYP